jgi:undecaprenyl diphosphate synthase
MPIEPSNYPHHIAIIMDGNNRWAKNKKKSQLSGHRAGAIQARSIINYCAKLGIEYLTLFAFSSENWLRPKKEVNALIMLFLRVLRRQEINKVHEQNIKINFIGETGRFPQELREQMQVAEELTNNNSGLVLNVAANFGGRWDIFQAAKAMAKAANDSNLDLENINEEHLSQFLSLHGYPDPDLCIRTGGEQRISNFLLWNLTYTELYFTDVFWPDFDEGALDIALEDFARRQRRYGKSSDQVVPRC